MCGEHGICIDKDKPLHSLLGEYIKYARAQGLIESDMTDRILKSSISTMEAFIGCATSGALRMTILF